MANMGNSAHCLKLVRSRILEKNLLLSLSETNIRITSILKSTFIPTEKYSCHTSSRKLLFATDGKHSNKSLTVVANTTETHTHTHTPTVQLI